MGAAPLERVPTIGDRRRCELLELHSEEDEELEEYADGRDLPRALKPTRSNSSCNSPDRRGHATSRARGSGFGLTEADVLLSHSNTDDETEGSNAHAHGRQRSKDAIGAAEKADIAEASPVKSNMRDSSDTSRDRTSYAHGKDVVDEGNSEKPTADDKDEQGDDLEKSLRELLVARLQEVGRRGPLSQPRACELVGARCAAESAQRVAALEITSQASHLPSPITSDDEAEALEEAARWDEEFIEWAIKMSAEIERPPEEYREDEDGAMRSAGPASPQERGRDEFAVDAHAFISPSANEIEFDEDVEIVTKAAVEEAPLPSPAPEPIAAETPEPHQPPVFLKAAKDEAEQLEPQAADDDPAIAFVSRQEEKDGGIAPWRVSLNAAVGEGDGASQGRLDQDNDIRALDATQEEKDRLVARWYATLDQAIGEGDGPSQDRLEEDNHVQALDATQQEKDRLVARWHAQLHQAIGEGAELSQLVDDKLESRDMMGDADVEADDAMESPRARIDAARRLAEDWFARVEELDDAYEDPADVYDALETIRLPSDKEISEEQAKDAATPKTSFDSWKGLLNKMMRRTGLSGFECGSNQARLSAQDDDVQINALDAEAHPAADTGSLERDQQLDVDQEMAVDEACALLDSIDKEQPQFMAAMIAVLRHIATVAELGDTYVDDFGDEGAYAEFEDGANVDYDENCEMDTEASAFDSERADNDPARAHKSVEEAGIDQSSDEGSANGGEEYMDDSEANTEEEAQNHLEKVKSPRWSTEPSSFAYPRAYSCRVLLSTVSRRSADPGRTMQGPALVWRTAHPFASVAFPRPTWTVCPGTNLSTASRATPLSKVTPPPPPATISVSVRARMKAVGSAAAARSLLGPSRSAFSPVPSVSSRA